MINIIAAVGENRELGKDNKLLWHIPEDMKYFRRMTVGHPVIVGRKTYESIGRPLPDRTNIVVTRNLDPSGLGVNVAGLVIKYTINSAVDYANTLGTGEVFIIGGAQIYTQVLPIAEILYLTIVHGKFGADVFFPKYDKDFEEVDSRDVRDENYRYTFKTFKRR